MSFKLVTFHLCRGKINFRVVYICLDRLVCSSKMKRNFKMNFRVVYVGLDRLVCSCKKDLWLRYLSSMYSKKNSKKNLPKTTTTEGKK